MKTTTVNLRSIILALLNKAEHTLSKYLNQYQAFMKVSDKSHSGSYARNTSSSNIHKCQKPRLVNKSQNKSMLIMNNNRTDTKDFK